MLNKSLHFLALLALLLPFAACTDDFPTGDYEIGEGEALVTASVDFHPLVATENETGGRAVAGSQPGDLIKSIDDLTVFMYDSEGKLVDIYTQDDFVDYSVKKKGRPAQTLTCPTTRAASLCRARNRPHVPHLPLRMSPSASTACMPWPTWALRTTRTPASVSPTRRISAMSRLSGTRRI